MKSKDLYEFYLKKYGNINILKEKINLNFDQMCSDFEFKKEFSRFLHFTQSFFTKDGILLTSFNSYCYPLDKEIPYLYNLFNKSLNMKDSIYSQYISEYLVSYNRSLNSIKYKSEIKSINEFKEKFYCYFEKKDFYGKGYIFERCLLFYVRLTNYTKKSKTLIFDDKIKRIFENIGNKNPQEHKIIFNNIILNGRFLDQLIIFDYNIDDHLKQYEDYIIKNCNLSFGGDRSLDLILFLDKKNKLSEESLLIFFNKLIDIFNNIIVKGLNREDNIIQSLAEIDDAVKTLEKLKKIDYNKFEKDFKSKINECTIKILNIKREITGDKSYVMKDMHESRFEIKIDNNISKLIKDINNNILYLYVYFRIDFNNELERSIKLFSDHPMSKMFTNYSIDDKKQTYKKNPLIKKSTYKNYYDKKGKQIVERDKNSLNNLLQKDYYETMLQDCNHFLLSSVNLIVLQLAEGYNSIKSIIREQLNYTDVIFDNDYIIISDILIRIEYEIFNIYNLNGLENIDLKEPERLLENLFAFYSENDEYRNGLMMVNYYLYEKNGLDLRNRFMHGEMLHKDLKEEMIIVSSCVIFLIYMKEKIINE